MARSHRPPLRFPWVLAVLALAACGGSQVADVGAPDFADVPEDVPDLLGGDPLPDGACLAGQVAGCHSFGERAVCNGEGVYVPEPCPSGQRCVLDGQCRATVCTPKFGVCADPTHFKTCLEDGSGYGEPVACPETLVCVGAKCVAVDCTSEIKIASYMGCEYWTVDLHNWDTKDYALSPPADIIPHAVVLSNPGTEPAVVTFQTQALVTLDFPAADLTLAPGDTRVFTMPDLSLTGTRVTSQSVRITATHPITAHQFNPLNNVGVASNDASLLLPANVLGKEYLAISYPTTYVPEMMGVKEMTNSGFVTVVATSPGGTQVEVFQAGGQIEAGPGISMVKKGQGASFYLQRFEVLNLEADHPPGLATYMYDLTGTAIRADKPIAVFGGHECAVVAPEGKSCCCCDHLEEQLIPLYAWGNEYLAIRNKPRGGAAEMDYWLVMAGTEAVTVHTDPPVPGLDGVTMNTGEFRYIATAESFAVTANGPIAVANYMMSQECCEQVIGDPSLTVVPAVLQYRKDYAVLTPDKYAEDWVTVVRPVGLAVTLDGVPISAPFEPVASGAYEYAYLPMQPGVHHFAADAGFGIVSYGYDGAVSYGVPGGMNLLGTETGGL